MHIICSKIEGLLICNIFNCVCTVDEGESRVPTMLEVLSSIPGFSLVKPRKRPGSKRLSAAAQLQQAKADGCVDLETPDSVLAQISLRSLLNKQTFSMLPRLYQHKLVQMLPQVDRDSLNETQSDFRFVFKILSIYFSN